MEEEKEDHVSQVSIFEYEKKRSNKNVSRKRLHVEIHPEVVEKENMK